MIHYKLPDGFGKCQPPFHLAMEEWISASLPGDDVFFVWQVEPSVICGRNQQIESEVDLDYCRRHGIGVYRRKSGGGCVYADADNLMMSFITPDRAPVPEIFARYSAMIVSALRTLGIDAEVTGRNDITVGGRKVSGNAFYRTPSGASIVHGTLLCDTDMDNMLNAITPSRAKLESKGVKSVESRITTLSRHTSLTVSDIKEALPRCLCDATATVDPGRLPQIEAIEKTYYADSWLFPHRRGTRPAPRRRVPGVGEIGVDLTLGADGSISGVELVGDFFFTVDPRPCLLERLTGAIPTRDGLARALDGVDMTRMIPDLDTNHFINLIVR